MRNLILLLCLLTSLNCLGQLFHEVYLDSTRLPKELSWEGTIKTAVQWTDEDGINILITTETGSHASKTEKNPDYRDAELYASHYIKENGVFKRTWKVSDFIKTCPMDIEATFLKNTFQLTDLDSNGIAEIWLMYKTVCHGDVSPSNMKIILYQGKQKYAMRGRNKVEYETGKFDGGEYTFDKAFNAAPESFRKEAVKLWNKNIFQTW